MLLGARVCANHRVLVLCLSRRKQGFESIGIANNFNELVGKFEWMYLSSPNFLQLTGSALNTSNTKAAGSNEHKVGVVGSNPIARSRFVLRCSYLAAPPQRRLPLVLPGEALGSSRISNWVQRTPMGGPAGLRMGIQDGLIESGRRGTQLHEDRATPAAPRPQKNAGHFPNGY